MLVVKGYSIKYKYSFHAMEELGSSELGTHEFWMRRYNEEIDNFESHGDPGEIWFGEDSIERVLHWLKNRNISKCSKIVDIGCGNGIFLIELGRDGFNNLHGADYCEEAIILSKAIASKQDIHINYFICDVLEGINDIYDIIHDKGTYDAISLTENPKMNRDKYIMNIHNSLENNGYFIITSCNWTEAELNEQFTSKFTCIEIIPTPQFKFGGKLGSLVSTIVYKKVS